ncbi:hypothetical protein PIB30_108936, partial [Stylosanthes scabra]|nr:hypothetical protein [Stylosanthes scabra]
GCKSSWVVVVKTKPRGRLETDATEVSEPFQVDATNPARLVYETGPPDTLRNTLAEDDIILLNQSNQMINDDEGASTDADQEDYMAGRESSRSSRSSSRGRGRGRGRAVPEVVPSASPSASTPGTSQVVPSTQAPLDPSPQPTPTDSGAAVAPAGGVDADSSHGSQQVPSAAPPTKTAITWDEQKGRSLHGPSRRNLRRTQGSVRGRFWRSALRTYCRSFLPTSSRPLNRPLSRRWRRVPRVPPLSTRTLFG